MTHQNVLEQQRIAVRGAHLGHLEWRIGRTGRPGVHVQADWHVELLGESIEAPSGVVWSDANVLWAEFSQHLQAPRGVLLAKETGIELRRVVEAVTDQHPLAEALLPLQHSLVTRSAADHGAHHVQPPHQRQALGKVRLLVGGCGEVVPVSSWLRVEPKRGSFCSACM